MRARSITPIVFALACTEPDLSPISAMVWDGCHGGSCAPSFYPIADGRARLLRCYAGSCSLFTYVYWSPENCNRLTACPDYNPGRKLRR